MKTSDQLIERVGGFGLFQKRALTALSLAGFFISQPVIIVGVFIIYTPPHRCFLPEIDETTNFTALQEILPDVPNKLTNSTDIEVALELSRFIPVETGPDGNPTWSQCYRYKNVSDNAFVSSSSSTNLTKIKCNNGWKYFAEPGLLTASMEFDLVCDRSWLAPLGTSLTLLGFMFGNLGGGFLADRYGRRWTNFFGCFGVGFCLLLISFFPLWEATLPLWFLSGCFYIVRGTIPVTIINEQIPIKKRYLSNFIHLLANGLGNILITLLNYLIKNWHHYLTLHAAMQLLSLVPLYLFVKESLTWLLQKQKYKDAEALLQETAKVNKTKFEEKLDFVKLDNNCNQEEHCLNGSSEEIKKNKSKQKLSYIDFVKVPFLRKRVIILAIAWIAVTSAYFGFSINSNNLGGDRYVTALLIAAAEIPSVFVCYFGLKVFGGKTSFMMTIGLCGITLFITPLLLKINETAVIVNNLIGKSFASTSFALVYVFAGDFFPTLLRTQAYGAAGFASRITSMLIPYLIYAGEYYMKELPYLVLGSIAILTMITSCFLPETKNTQLPDTMEDAKNQDKNSSTCLSCISTRTKTIQTTHSSSSDEFDNS